MTNNDAPSDETAGDLLRREMDALFDSIHTPEVRADITAFLNSLREALSPEVRQMSERELTDAAEAAEAAKQAYRREKRGRTP